MRRKRESDELVSVVGPPERTLTIVVRGERLDVSQEFAEALADELWKGLRPGSATSAARLSTVLSRSDPGAARAVEFAAYEADAVYSALEVVESQSSQ